MDPALHELIGAGQPSDEVAVLLRLGHDVVPEGARIVARLGNIATARVSRSAIWRIHETSGVRSVKAPHLYGPDWLGVAQEADSAEVRPSDERRPDDVTQTGRGVVVALIDWGLDVGHPDFRNRDGSSRIMALWDQRARLGGHSNNRYGYGWVHDRASIDRALRQRDPYSVLSYHPADAGAGPTHGTHTAGIAAGNGRGGGPAGMAPECDIVFVHLATATGERGDNLGDSVALLEAIDFIARVADQKPWVLSLSMGRHAGPHDGCTLTEQGIDSALSAVPGRACVQSTGNYYSRPIHTQGVLRPGEVRDIGFHTGEEDGFAHEIDIWYSGRDRITFELIAPSNTPAARAETGARTTVVIGSQSVGRLYNRRRDPNNHDNQAHVYLDPSAPRGTWTLRLRGTDVIDGRYHCWVERDPSCSTCQPSFEPNDVVPSSTTGTICNGFLTVAVGAYDAHRPDRPLATFSSSGPTRDGRFKPDIVAPGVEVLSARSAPRTPAANDSKVARMSGTSMAAPFVAGTVALMFEAASQPLPVRQTRELLLQAANPLVGESQARWGSGYVDVAAAVARAAELRADYSRHQFKALVTEQEKTARKGRTPSALEEAATDPAWATASSCVPITAGRSTSMSSQTLILNGQAQGGKCGCGRHHTNSADSAADLLRQMLEAPGLFARRWNRPEASRGFEIIAGPGQPLISEPLAGDILIRVIDGGSGHAAVVASPGLWRAEELGDRGLQTNSEAEGFVHVQEHGPFPRDASERFARGVTDRAGRLLEDLLLLRIVAPPPPTVVQVQQPQPTPGAKASTTAGTDQDDAAASIGEWGENIEAGENLDSPAEDTGVIGGDDRVRITPTSDAPWRWMCHVELQDQRDRSEGHGSGVLISDRHVLTAAHVVWDAAQDLHLHGVQVSPGLDYDDDPFGTWVASRVRVCPKYDPSDKDNQEWDYALITLDKSVGKAPFKSLGKQPLRFWGAGEFAGKFTMGPGDANVLVHSDALTAGYRGNKAYGKELWFAKGKFRQISAPRYPNSIYMTADTTEGQSGSPLWVKEEQDALRMVGVVVCAGKNANIARRITPGMIAELRKWIAEDKETPWMGTGEAAGIPEFAAGDGGQSADSWTNPEDEVTCDHIDASQLSWPGASAQQLDLMRRVYLRQVTAACQSRAFVGDVADSELGDVENGVRLRQPAAPGCRALLASARLALSSASGVHVSNIGVLSGYRPATRQLANWNRNFPRYFGETQADRAAADGGEFGDAAAAFLTRYISRRLAAPGFSLHNDGRAVDFNTVQDGKSMGADTSASNRANWKASWFFNFLVANANSYGFFQNTSIDEPWHWEYRAAAPAAQSTEAIGLLPSPDTNAPEGYGFKASVPAELTIAKGRLERSNTPLLAAHRGTQPDLILRWNDMTDPASVDVVVHLHGYSSDRALMSLRRKEAYSGLDFSNPDDSNDTRPGRTAATLCVLPRGSYTGDEPKANPERYTFPALATPARLRELVTYSLGQFQSSTGASSGLSMGRMILTAHSGGGAGLMRILANNTNDEMQIDEIEIFDALYGSATQDAVRPLTLWINRRIAAEIQNWTTGKTQADSGICILFRRGGTDPQSQLVQGAIQAAISAAPSDAQAILNAAYRVHRTEVAHGEIPRRFGWRLLADKAQIFPETAGAVTAG